MAWMPLLLTAWVVPKEASSNHLNQLERLCHYYEHANDRDTVIGYAKVNHMPLDISAAVPLATMLTDWSRFWRFG